VIDKRLMYAQGQRVAKTMDGLRPGYAGPNEPNDGQGVGAGTSSNEGEGSSNQPETTRHNPHTDSGTSKTSTVSGNRMTSAARDFVQTLNHNRAREAAKTKTKFTPYGGGSKNYKEPFFDTGPGKFIKGLGKTALMAYGPAIFGPKFATGVKAYKGAKVVKDFFNKTDIFNTFDVKNPIDNLFSGKKTPTSKINNFNEGDGQDYKSEGEGLASLENMNALENEYILLLQKNLEGTFNDEEQVRFTMLKKILGK